MYNPLVSIIVPNYNYAQYLDLRMESILNQTYGNFEIIILDDCSTDNSTSVIEKYTNHPKVSKVIINEKNSGSPFIQWEKGISEASGEVIWIAESDDTCSPSFLESLVKGYVESNSVMAFCRSILVDEKGNKLRENHQMRLVTNSLSVDGKAFISQYLGFSNEVQNASSAIFSKKVALSIDKEYMNFKGAGDWFFWIKMSERGNVYFLNEELNNYRLHNNTTSSVVKSGKEFREMKVIYEWLLEKQYLNKTQFDECRWNNVNLISSLKEIPKDIKRDLYDMWDVPMSYRFCFKIRSFSLMMLAFLHRCCG